METEPQECLVAIGTHLELFVHLICEVAEEIEGVLLLPNIDRLTPQLELLPECLGRVILQSALHQVTKHTLQLGQDPCGGGGGGVGRGRREGADI